MVRNATQFPSLPLPVSPPTDPMTCAVPSSTPSRLTMSNPRSRFLYHSCIDGVTVPCRTSQGTASKMEYPAQRRHLHHGGDQHGKQNASHPFLLVAGSRFALPPPLALPPVGLAFVQRRRATSSVSKVEILYHKSVHFKTSDTKPPLPSTGRDFLSWFPGASASDVPQLTPARAAMEYRRGR